MPAELNKLPRHANKLGVFPLQMYTYHVKGNTNTVDVDPDLLGNVHYRQIATIF